MALTWLLTWHAGQLRLFVSNNDHTVKIFDVPSMRLMSTVTCPVAVNYAALSPDGRFLACVGDSGATHIYRAATTGTASLLTSLCLWQLALVLPSLQESRASPSCRDSR